MCIRDRFQIIQQLAVNKYMDKVDVEVLIQKNIDKENKKRAKKGLPPKKVTTVANANVRNIEKKKGCLLYTSRCV